MKSIHSKSEEEVSAKGKKYDINDSVHPFV